MRYLIPIVLIIIIIALAILVVQQQDKYEQLEINSNEIIDKQEDRIDELTGQVTAVKESQAELIAELKEAKEGYEELYETHSSLRESYETLLIELEDSIEKIEVFKDDLNSSMAWFEDNSYLHDIPNEGRIKRSIDGRCYDEECNVKLGCFFLVNSEKLGYKYISDPKIYGEDDKLQSLHEFVHNWGGDCEDYSLFYKAEFNHVLSVCPSLRIEAWIPGGSDYFLDMQEEWYIEDASGIILPEGYIYPNVVCGNIQNQGKSAGHCVVAFSKDIIRGLDELDYLQGAPLVEPQDGRYIGTIGRDYYLSQNSIWLVITDFDLMMYSNHEWIGFRSASEELESLNRRLSALFQ